MRSVAFVHKKISKKKISSLDQSQLFMQSNLNFFDFFFCFAQCQRLNQGKNLLQHGFTLGPMRFCSICKQFGSRFSSVRQILCLTLSMWIQNRQELDSLGLWRNFKAFLRYLRLLSHIASFFAASTGHSRENNPKNCLLERQNAVETHNMHQKF